MHLISGAREGINGLSIRTDRKDRKLVCLRSVNCISFTYTHWTGISGFSKYFSSSDVITAGFLVALLSDCVDMLFLDVLLFRSCRSDELPFCGFESSFSRIILCFDLRNIVGTLCSTATCTSIGNFLWQMPSQASLTSTAKKPF